MSEESHSGGLLRQESGRLQAKLLIGHAGAARSGQYSLAEGTLMERPPPNERDEQPVSTERPQRAIDQSSAPVWHLLSPEEVDELTRIEVKLTFASSRC